jgi:hypothetical protein
MQRGAVSILAAGCLLLGFGAGAWFAPLRERGSLSPERAGAEARAILADPDPLERSIRWGALLERAGTGAEPPLRDAIAASPLDVVDFEVIAFAMWWARFDPKAALAWTSTEWRAGANLVIGSVFRVWAHEDPKAAFAGINGIPEIRQDAAIDAVISGWQESGKPGLVEHVESLQSGPLRQRVGESLARRLVLALGTQEALHWLDSLTDPAFREMMTMRVASTATVQGDASVIAAWATPQVTTGRALPSGFPRRIATRWILRDSPAALAWLASLPPGSDRDDGVTESFRDWLRASPGAALHWVQTTELEPWSEPAFAIYARYLSRQKPKDALDLASRFSDPDLRHRTITVIARAWAAEDPKAAQEWLAQADLPADLKQRASMQQRPQADQPGPTAP